MADALDPILVVDDEAPVRTALARALQRVGYQVVHADNAEAGLDLLKTQSFTCAITDLRMPGMGGHGFLRNVQKLAPGMPVIVMSGNGDMEDVIECMRHGALDFIVKPWADVALRAAVERAAEVREAKKKKGGGPPEAPGLAAAPTEQAPASVPPQPQGFAPPQSFAAQPQQALGQPQQGFGQPQQGFAAQPPQAFGQPQQGFGQPQQGFPATFGATPAGFGGAASAAAGYGGGFPQQQQQSPANAYGHQPQGFGAPPPAWAGAQGMPVGQGFMPAGYAPPPPPQQQGPSPLQSVLEKLRTGDIPIPAMSQVALAARQLSRSPHGSAQMMKEIIEPDTVICGRVMKVANSSFYATMGKVADLKGAISRVGFKEIAQLMDAIVTKQFHEVRDPHVKRDVDAVWSHTWTRAVTMRMVAQDFRRMAVDPEEAYLAGLFADIGAPFLFKVLSDLGHGGPELQAFVAEHHTSVGQAIGQAWQLPALCQEAIRRHHEHPQRPEAEPAILRLLWVAEVVCHGLGAAHDARPIAAGPWMLAGFDLQPHTLQALQDRVAQYVRDQSPAFG